MATQQQGWRALVSLWILTALITSLAGGISTDLNEYLKPIVVGVTNNAITIRMTCLIERTCQDVSLKYKKLTDSTWKENKFRSISRINGLESDAYYDVETIVKLNGTDSKRNIQISTCPENIPKLTGFRAVKTGPGWLDLRWDPIKENCKSNIYYLVRYGLINSLSSWKAYGVFKGGNGSMIFRPTHPCATWDTEFCLLLTDYVTSGGNHTVKVKPVRYDPLLGIAEQPTDLNEENMAILKNVFADSKFTGPYILGQADAHVPCQLLNRQDKSIKTPPPNLKMSETEDKGMLEGRQQPVLVPLLIVVVAVVLLVGAFTVLIVAWRQRNKRTKSSQIISPGISPSISTPPVNAGNTDGSTLSDDDVDRASNMYDDCMTSAHIRGSPIPVPAQSQNQMVFSERFRGLQSALQKEIATASASRVADKKTTAAVRTNGNGTATKQVPDSGLYLPMEPQPIYDDAQGLKNFSGTIYENESLADRESNMYMEPTSPIYDEAKVVPARETSVPYNEVYAHSPESPWRSW